VSSPERSATPPAPRGPFPSTTAPDATRARARLAAATGSAPSSPRRHEDHNAPGGSRHDGRRASSRRSRPCRRSRCKCRSVRPKRRCRTSRTSTASRRSSTDRRWTSSPPERDDIVLRLAAVTPHDGSSRSGFRRGKWIASTAWLNRAPTRAPTAYSDCACRASGSGPRSRVQVHRAARLRASLRPQVNIVSPDEAMSSRPMTSLANRRR
jgi:hypothetical protein